MPRIGHVAASLLGLCGLVPCGCELEEPRTPALSTMTAATAPGSSELRPAPSRSPASAPPATASTQRPTTAASGATWASPADCAHVRRVLDAEPTVRLTGFGLELYETEARLKAAEAAIAAAYRKLPRSTLRTSFVDYAHAVAFLKDVVSTRLAVHELGVADLSMIEHAFELGLRSRQLARHAAWAECEPDPSRDQSPQWKEQAIERSSSLGALLASCVRPEWERPDGSETAFMLKLHIGPDGHVALAGLAPPYCAPRDCPFHLELAWCAVQRAEQLTFPPPHGTAILQLPLVHSPP